MTKTEIRAALSGWVADRENWGDRKIAEALEDGTFFRGDFSYEVAHLDFPSKMEFTGTRYDGNGGIIAAADRVFEDGCNAIEVLCGALDELGL